MDCKIFTSIFFFYIVISRRPQSDITFLKVSQLCISFSKIHQNEMVK